MDSASKPRLVPFPRAFALFGYVIFSVLSVCAVIEGLSAIAVRLHSSMTERAVGPEWKFIKGHCRGLGTGKCSQDLSDLDMASANPEYGRYPWGEAYWAEERSRAAWWWTRVPYTPFSTWGNHVLGGNYLNVDESLLGTWRRSANAPCSGSRRTIWFFGGSVAFGYGSPDDMTIPSLLSKRLQEGGACVEIVNMAVEGYVSSQELIELEQQLRAGRRPDIAVFLDGYNDADSGAAQSSVATGHLNLVVVKNAFEGRHSNVLVRWFESSYTARLLKGVLKRLPSRPKDRIQTVDSHGHLINLDLDRSPAPTQAKNVLDVYATNRQIARSLGELYGFETYFFWQPTLSNVKLNEPSEYTKFLTDVDDTQGMSQFSTQAISRVYDLAERRAAQDGFVYLGRVFDGSTAPLFIDAVHVTPQANAMLAEAVAKVIAAGGK